MQVGEFRISWIISTVPLTQFSHNTFFFQEPKCAQCGEQVYVYSKIQTILNESYQLTIGKYQIHWYYITRTTRQHGRAVLASKFFSADPSAPFAFVPHRSVVYSIRIWQHVHTISKRLTCYWQGHMMCGAAKGPMGAIHKLPCVSLTHRKNPAHCNASTRGPPLTWKSLTRFPLPWFLAYVRVSGGISVSRGPQYSPTNTNFM